MPGLFEGAPIGVKAYFDMINAQGGVDGRKLLVDSKDDAFSGQQNQTETQEAINSDFALVGSFSLFDGYGCTALASDTAVPDVSVTLDAGTNALPNDFSAQPLSGSGDPRAGRSTTRSTTPRTRPSAPSSRTSPRPRPRWPSSSPA